MCLLLALPLFKIGYYFFRENLHVYFRVAGGTWKFMTKWRQPALTNCQDYLLRRLVFVDEWHLFHFHRAIL